MSGETAEQESGWTVDTVKAYLDTRINDLEGLLSERYSTQTKAVDAAFAAAERAVQTALLSAKEAVEKAEVAADKRFAAVNEFRAQLSDQAATFMPRSESISRHDRAAEQIHALAAKIEEEAARGSEQRLTMENRLLSMISAMTSRLDLTQGRSTGLHDGWGLVVGAVGVVAAAIGIVVGLR